MCPLYLAENMDELSFNDGDLIMLKTRVGGDWLRGKLINGGEGIFPANFVEIVVSTKNYLLALSLTNIVHDHCY